MTAAPLRRLLLTGQHFRPSSTLLCTQSKPLLSLPNNCNSTPASIISRYVFPTTSLNSHAAHVRNFTTSRILRELQQKDVVVKTEQQQPVPEFEKSEKAAKAAHVNLSAKLHKDGVQAGNKPGMGEIIRLLKIARPEAKWLGGECLESE